VAEVRAHDVVGGPADARARLAARIGELETSRAGVVDAAEAERRRIERDLHDGAQQRLVSLAMELGRARAKFSSDPRAAEAIVGQAHEQAKEALAELRNLVRGVHPPVLSDRGLDAALSGLAEEFLRAVAARQPDVVVVDVRMPPTFTDEGLRAALVVRSTWPDVGVLVLSQYVEERYATELLSDRPQGVGYLLKDRVADLAEFLDALERVAAGGSALDPEVVAQLLARSRHPLAALTPRERDVLALMAEGRSNAAIAAELVVSDGAVEKHISSIFGKLGLAPADRDHRRVLAVLRYLGAEGT
jgi:DNA-binding NarL/FixJ family response regulator